MVGKANCCIFRLAVMVMAMQFLLGSCGTDNVTISGTVSDYSGNAVPGADVIIKNEAFEDLYRTKSDCTGHYSIAVPPGLYSSMVAINLDDYAKNALEFWTWNLDARKDRIIDIHYGKLEIYGVNIFRVQGAVPTFQIYFRPMSLTRYSAVEDGDDIEKMCPPVDSLDITVEINSQSVRVLKKQQIEEYVNDGKSLKAALITVERPDMVDNESDFVFRIMATDIANGDSGEALYFMSEKHSAE